MFIIHFMTDQQVNALARKFKGQRWVVIAAGDVQQAGSSQRRIIASDGATGEGECLHQTKSSG
jgi:hypothetical protein